MEVPDESIKITSSGRCILQPNFHYQKHQKTKFKEKQSIKSLANPTGLNLSPSKMKKTNLFNLPISKLLLMTQEVFNAFIRKRDSMGDYFICESCKKPKPLDQMNAGHFYSAGNHSYLRFNENNVHGQCIQCNLHLHGNLLPYRENLIKKIGIVELEKLDIWKNYCSKWDRLQLVGMIEYYRNRIKDLESK